MMKESGPEGQVIQHRALKRTMTAPSLSLRRRASILVHGSTLATTNALRGASGSGAMVNETSRESEPLIGGSTRLEDNHDDNAVTHFIRVIILSNWINLLLLTIPFGFIAKYAKWGDTAVFVFNFVPIIPLAWLLGRATEELACRTSQSVGGLLNATFGNAVEMIISIMALRKNLFRVVQASLLGSILSNLLLVAGCCFLFGGIKHKQQRFNPTASDMNSSLLMLAMLGLVIPTTFGSAVGSESDKVLRLSRVVGVFLFVVYLLFLFFQLRTHAHLYEDEDDEGEEATISLWAALGLLAAVTALVCFHSEFLVGSIESVAKGWGLSDTFLSIVLLPIVSNAAEHVTAVTVAMKDKMDLAIGVAIGSSAQISLCVIPLLVLIGWMSGHHLTLDFHAFETITVLLAVLIVNIITRDGESNWLEGALLLSTYGIIAAAFYLYPENPALPRIVI